MSTIQQGYGSYSSTTGVNTIEGNFGDLMMIGLDNSNADTGQYVGASYLSITQDISDISIIQNTPVRTVSDQQITGLYTTLLNRAPDVGGFQYWQEQASSGMSLSEMKQAFVASSEYAQIQAGANTTTTPTGTMASTTLSSAVRTVSDEQITGLFTTLLNRAPDASGLQYWQEQANNGMSLSEMRQAFVASSEYAQIQGAAGGTVSSDQIKSLYTNLLNRSPNANEVQYWQEQANNGLSLSEMRKAFVASPEYSQIQAAAEKLCPGFDALAYVNANPDLCAAADAAGATLSNPDARRTWGANHFVHYGINEGRPLKPSKPADWDATSYIYSNLDLQNYCRNTLHITDFSSSAARDWAEQHYNDYGCLENRQYANRQFQTAPPLPENWNWYNYYNDNASSITAATQLYYKTYNQAISFQELANFCKSLYINRGYDCSINHVDLDRITVSNYAYDYFKIDRSQDLANPSNISPSHLENVKEPLFVNDVSPLDVQQGQAGDCYFLAALASLAASDPQMIKDMIHPNLDGSYTVDFHDGAGALVSTIVKPDLMVRDDTGHPTFASFNVDDQHESWVAIIEKGYAQVMGGYAIIGSGGDAIIGLQALTGHRYTEYAFTVRQGVDSNYLLDRIKQSLDNNLPMIAATSGLTPDLNIVQNHAYAIVGYDPTTQKIRLQNPWRFYEPGSDGKDDGQFNLSLEDFTRNFMCVSIDQTLPPYIASA